MISYKPGVRVEQRTAALDRIENCALAVQAEVGYPGVLVVTSINDSAHSQKPRSRHYTNEAEDFRTKHVAPNGSRHRGDMGSTSRKRRFAKLLRERLGSLFTVILEGLGQPHEHIHCQVRKGHRYP